MAHCIAKHYTHTRHASAAHRDAKRERSSGKGAAGRASEEEIQLFSSRAAGCCPGRLHTFQQHHSMRMPGSITNAAAYPSQSPMRSRHTDGHPACHWRRQPPGAEAVWESCCPHGRCGHEEPQMQMRCGCCCARGLESSGSLQQTAAGEGQVVLAVSVCQCGGYPEGKPPVNCTICGRGCAYGVLLRRSIQQH